MCLRKAHYTIMKHTTIQYTPPAGFFFQIENREMERNWETLPVILDSFPACFCPPEFHKTPKWIISKKETKFKISWQLSCVMMVSWGDVHITCLGMEIMFQSLCNFKMFIKMTKTWVLGNNIKIPRFLLLF
jgi:hypothetical protein